VLRETAVLIVIGLAAGVPASLACARLIQSKLYGLRPADPMTLGAALGIMIYYVGLSARAPRIAGRSAHLAALRVRRLVFT
jgi:hypothetical protein